MIADEFSLDRWRVPLRLEQRKDHRAQHNRKRHAKGRIVSSLEGGYNLNALARSVEAHIRVLADL